jgi:folate-binding protein YgfZ
MEDLIKEHEVFEKAGGIFEIPKAFLRVAGPDATDFLHRITSQDIKSLKDGDAKGCALLNSDGTIVSLFDILKFEEGYLFVIDENLKEKTQQGLEKLHFAEDLKVEDLSSQMKFLSVQGDVAKKDSPPEFGIVLEESDFEENKPGLHILINSKEGDKYKNDLGAKVLSLRLWDLMRLESGRVGSKDLSESTLVLEAPLDGYVSQNKGCYPGQEVVERIFTYGNISKKIVGVKLLENRSRSDSKAKLFSNSENAGNLISSASIPWSGKTLGFGLVRKPFYINGQKLKVEGGGEAEVYLLPRTFLIEKRQKGSISPN